MRVLFLGINCLILLNGCITLDSKRVERSMLVEKLDTENIHKIKYEIEKHIEYKEQSNLEYIFIYYLSFKSKENLEQYKTRSDFDLLMYLHDYELDFPYFDSIIYHEETLIAVTNGIRTFNVSRYNNEVFNSERDIRSFYLENKPELLFKIDPSPTNLLFALKEGEILALLIDKDSLIILNNDDFISCCWNENFDDELFNIHY